MVKNIAILGGGAGGLTIAADVAPRGFNVNIFELPQFKQTIEPVKAKGGVEAEWRDGTSGFGKVNKVTSDVKEAVDGADFISVVVPSYGHRTFAELLAPHVRDGQIIAFVGEGGGSLEMAKAMRDKGIKKSVVIGETNTLPYGARLKGPGAVRSQRKTGGTKIAALPSRNNGKLYSEAKELWSFIEQGENVMETVLLNFNAIDHVANFILNLGRVEGTTGDMKFWGEGATPSVAKMIETVDMEIMAIRSALGFKDKRVYREYLVAQGFQDKVQPTTYQALHVGSIAESVFTCGPNATEHRYITEDVPYSLVLIASLGDAMGVHTPIIDSLVNIASAFKEKDYWKEGRTLAKLGVPTDPAKLKKFLTEGPI